VLAQIERAGLWYAYEQPGAEPARVAFVPRRALL
jgi:hypothetical protein